MSMLLQLDNKQLKTRQISQIYLQIQQSCEYLNHILRFNSKNLYQIILQYQSIDQKEMFTLMVQQIYLYYIIYSKNYKILLSKDIYIKNVTANVNTINKVYILQKHYHTLSNTLQQYIDKQFISLDISECIEMFSNNLIKIIDNSLIGIQKYFMKYKDIFNIPYIRNYYEEFNLVYYQFIKNHLKLFKQPRLIMECLEKTELFRDNSLLITIKPSLIFQKLRHFIAKGEIFQDLIEIQNNLKKMLKKGKRNEAIYWFVKQTFLILVANKIIHLNISIDTNKHSSITNKKQFKQNFQNNPPQILNYLDQTSNNINNDRKSDIIDRKPIQFFTKQSKFNLNKSNFINYITSNNFQQYQYQNKDQKFLNKNNQFIMEVNYQQEIINIKLVLEENLNVDKLDFILYEANKICQEWYTPTLQIIQNKKNQQNSAVNNTLKTLAFAISFKINPSNHPIGQILTIFDILIVHQKILIKQLQKAPFKRDFPYKYNYSNQNIKRMNNLLLSNIEKVYSAQLEQSSQEDL